MEALDVAAGLALVPQYLCDVVFEDGMDLFCAEPTHHIACAHIMQGFIVNNR